MFNSTYTIYHQRESDLPPSSLKDKFNGCIERHLINKIIKVSIRVLPAKVVPQRDESFVYYFELKKGPLFYSIFRENEA